jgi:hypothetical protein
MMLTKNFSHGWTSPYDARMPFIASSFMLLAAHVAAPAAASLPPSRVCIVLDLDARLPAAIQRLAVEEAARVWAPYRVDVMRRTVPPVESRPFEGAVLSVRLAGVPHRSRAAAGAFGSIQFVGGRPEPIVFLHYEAIRRAIADSVAFGLREEQWPPALRDRVLGQIVGRVLAHEIGHFVLRSPRHASRGLMRPIQFMPELIAGTGELFGLTPEDLNLLRTALTLPSAVEPGNAGG